MKDKVRRFAALAAATFCIEGASTFAYAQVCVDPAGGGCETTIQAGVNLATAGQTVTVAAATYAEEVTIPAGKDGLVIEARGAVLDNPSILNGIIILSNDVSISGLTIRNGRYGVTIGELGVTDVTGTTLSKMRFEAQDLEAVHIPGSDSVTIEKCAFIACGGNCVRAGEGDTPDDSDGIVVTKSRFEICDDACIRIRGSSAVASKNKFQSAEDGFCVNVQGNDAVVEKNKGLNISGLAGITGENPRVLKNKARSYGDTAFSIYCTADCAAGAIVQKNSARESSDDTQGFQIVADGPGLVVDGNTSVASADEGFSLIGDGIVATNNKSIRSGGDDSESGFFVVGQNHVLTGNVSIGNADDGFALANAVNVTLTDNVALENFGDGFEVGLFSTGILLTNNLAEDNIGEGFALDSFGDPDPVTATLTGNTATGNRVPFCVSVVAGGPADGGGNSFTVPGAPACEVDH